MKIINVGIIGPRPYSIGGHDPNNPIRQDLMTRYESILMSYKSSTTTPIGLTGLGLGVEQDFAKVCIKNNVKYICYLPYEDQEKNWFGNLDEYYNLLEHAEDIELLSKGVYTPKKIYNKYKSIAENSDVIILVYNHLVNISEVVKYFDKKPIYILSP